MGEKRWARNGLLADDQYAARRNSMESFARRVSRQELQAAFASGWEIESIEECRFEVRPDLTDIQFSPGGPLAWFSVIRRTAGADCQS